MRKNNVLEFQGREARLDPLTELLRKGAQELIGQAVESELAELLVQYSDCRTSEGKAAQWLSTTPRAANGHWSSDGTDPEGSFEER
jgi:hypothetical protein